MKRTIGVAVGLAFAAIAQAGVYGSNPTVNLGYVDTCPGCLYVYVDFPAAAAGQQVSSYSFYAGATGNEITPVLFENTAGSDFKIIGLGTTQTPSATGTNTFAFGLTSGTATVLDGNTFFGWLDGSPGGSTNTGTITSDYPNGSGPAQYFNFSSGPVTVGETIDFLTYTSISQSTRTYSLDVTTTAVPEPGLYCALGAGLIGLMVVRRRKIA